jgi:hypothetical protein
MGDLPSTHNSGQTHADLPGSPVRCTSGLVVDLEAFQARRMLPSNPYDVVSDGGNGWYVSDGAANNVLHR